MCRPTRLGTVGPRTKVGYAIFETYVTGQPNIRKDGMVSSDDEYARAVKYDPCDVGKFRNIFEAEQIDRPNDLETLASALKDSNITGFVDPGPQVSSLNAMRANIKAANAQLGTGSPDGAAADEATPQLYSKLGILIRKK